MPEITLEPLPMEAAQKFWADKMKLSPGEFYNLSDEAKPRAFVVSGIAKGDELTTVFDAMQRAIDKGTTFGDFKKDIRGITEKRGWTGKRAWRVETIFRTNIQTAYSVGRYKEMQAVKETRPYWQYSAVNDSRTRPTHAALHGKVFPADHPFWDKWYPPNGFNCRCGVVTLSQDDVDSEGFKVERDDPSGKLIEPIDPVTGQKLPARPLMPDRGFDFNPGKVQWGFAGTEEQGRFIDLENLKKASDYRIRNLDNMRAADMPDLKSQPAPSKKSDEFYITEFEKRYGEEKVLKDSIDEPVILSLRAFLKDKTKGEKGGWKFNKDGHGESIPLLQEMIENPLEIWLTPQKNETGKIRLTKRYISLWKTDDKERIGGLAAFEVVKGMFQGITAFLPYEKGVSDIEYLNRQRRGILLYGEKG